MGQKSRQKKNNKIKSNIQSQTTGAATRSGVTLAGLHEGSAGISQNKINPANVSYEMVGNLHLGIKKIVIILLVCILLLIGLFITKQKTSYINTIGNKVASFLKLS